MGALKLTYQFEKYTQNLRVAYKSDYANLREPSTKEVEKLRLHYSVFGMYQPGRQFNAGEYRFAFQSQESDDEIFGSHSSFLNFTYRGYDSRIGRFWSIDPLFSKYPYWTPYAFSGNIVIHAHEYEGLEAVVGVSMGGDVDYRKGHLQLLHAGSVTASVTSPNTPTDPSETVQLVDLLATATTNDPNNMIGFIALWGHGTGGNVYGSQGEMTNPTPTGYLDIEDLEGIREGMESGDIVFNENAVILITACNAGTDITVTDPDGTERTTSFAQELADITEAKVVAGRNTGVSPLRETQGTEMSYQVKYYSEGSFFQFQKGQTPFEIGNTYNTATGIERGTSLPPIQRMQPRTITQIPVETQEPTLIAR